MLSFKINLCIFSILCNTIPLNTTTKVEDSNLSYDKNNCFIKKDDNYWKLDWSNEFKHKSDLVGWIAENEIDKCHGNSIGQVSCNIAKNVLTQEGFLILRTRRENYEKFRYTAAQLSSKHNFTYGRVEIRAVLPVGKQIRTSIFTVNPKQSPKSDPQIDLMSKNQLSVLYRGVSFADDYESRDHNLKKPKNKTSFQFHLYGFEWDDQKIKFFYDNHFSKAIKFTENNTIGPMHQLRIQIGVGGMYFNPPYPQAFEQLSWKCPALIVDYVRYYHKITGTPVDSMNKCQFPSMPNNEGAMLNRLCNQTLSLSTI